MIGFIVKTIALIFCTFIGASSFDGVITNYKEKEDYFACGVDLFLFVVCVLFMVRIVWM